MRIHMLCYFFGLFFPAYAQRGAPIRLPEGLTGVWETSDGHGGAAGMLVGMTTEVAGQPKTLRGASQLERDFTVMLYHQESAMPGKDGAYFVATPGASTRWDGRLLRILHQPDVDVALAWDARNDLWRGHFRRKGFSAEVILRRPSPARNHSVLAGTWARQDGSYLNCLHIAQRADSTLLAWTDQLELTGVLKWGRFRPPPTTSELYGEHAGIVLLPNGMAEVVIGTDRALCCSRTELVRPTGSASMSAVVPGYASARTYRRMPGPSCIAAVKKP